MSSQTAGVNFSEDPLGSLIGVAANYFTYGAVGFDSEHGIKKGAGFSATKEITGANAAEEANRMAQQQVDETKAQAKIDRENAIKSKELNQITASNTAASASTSNVKSKTVSPKVGDVKDFLGL